MKKLRTAKLDPQVYFVHYFRVSASELTKKLAIHFPLGMANIKKWRNFDLLVLRKLYLCLQSRFDPVIKLKELLLLKFYFLYL